VTSWAKTGYESPSMIVLFVGKLGQAICSNDDGFQRREAVRDPPCKGGNIDSSSLTFQRGSFQLPAFEACPP
jgi:hypothetical protein